MSAHTIEVVDSLSLLALKVASNVFDLSSGLHHVSIRDQIVRAQLAVRDLKKGDAGLDSLLIVGAGVAGIAAALEAVRLKVSEVVVLEVQSQPFDMLHRVHNRYVGPFMYEWPSTFSRNQSYPEYTTSPWVGHGRSPLGWHAIKPLPANRLASKLRDQLLAQIADLNNHRIAAPSICVNVDKKRVQQFVKDFAHRESARALSRLQGHTPAPPLTFDCHTQVLWPDPNVTKQSCTPQYLLLAAGMGTENVTLVSKSVDGSSYTGKNYSGTPFWSDDQLLDPGTNNLQVSVFGGGDGALQDVLRVLTRRDHPLHLLAFLERDPVTRNGLRRIAPVLLDADRQARQFAAWSLKQDAHATIDAVCSKLARQLAQQRRVVRRLSNAIASGKGKVSLFVAGKHFDKAYLLNRFMVHLIIACREQHPAMWSGKMEFEVHFGQSAVAYAPPDDGRHHVTIARRNAEGATCHTHDCDRISVRYGITPGTVPGAQMIQLSKKPSMQRTTLARVELPFVMEERLV